MSGELKGCLLLTASRRDSSAPLTFGNAEEIDFDGRHSDIECRAGNRLLHDVCLKIFAIRVTNGNDAGESVHSGFLIYGCFGRFGLFGRFGNFLSSSQLELTFINTASD